MGLQLLWESVISPKRGSARYETRKHFSRFHQARVNAGAAAVIPAKVSTIVTAQRTDFCQPLK